MTDHRQMTCDAAPRPVYRYPCATGEHRGHRSRMLAEACLRVAEEQVERDPISDTDGIR